MNKIKRTKIQQLITRLAQVASDTERLLDEEQDCLDNLPENLQDSETGRRFEHAIDQLENAVDLVNSAVEYLQDIA